MQKGRGQDTRIVYRKTLWQPLLHEHRLLIAGGEEGSATV